MRGALRALDHFDVLIVGGGPAGCSVALRLAGACSVALLERRWRHEPRIGESLHPDGRRLLSDLGLLELMEAQGHGPYYANRSIWGGGYPVDVDFLRHPDGIGWHLDRARFDQWLCEQAVVHGARFVRVRGIGGLAYEGEEWRAELLNEKGSEMVRASIVVDAGGRLSPVARRLGISRRQVPNDLLVCGWVHLKDGGDLGRGLSIVESTCDGWWYTAPKPDGGRVLAFHTDRDMSAARSAADAANLAKLAFASTREIRRILPESSNLEVSAKGFNAANGSYLQSPMGTGWLAVGDAAFTTDPIATRGLLHALFTGLVAAQAIEAALSDRTRSFAGYKEVLSKLFVEYEAARRFGYSQERRFGSSIFWQRRH